MVVVLSHRRRQRGAKGQLLKSEMDTGYRERSKSPHITVSSSFVVDEFQSTFRTLASSNLHQHSRAGKGIILTVRSSASHSHTSANGHLGKGYPDISTRAFLRLLSTSHHHGSRPPPIYALADFDPDGIAIMSNYKHGSYTLSHENENLIVPSIRWLGIRSSDILNEPNCEEAKGLLKLSGRDRKKAVKMLEKSAVMREDGGEAEWRRELQVMLMLNVKAEIEVLGDREGV